MTNSINTNISAYYAQANIARASAAASTSVSRLSSGNFITKASDDVARLSIGTSFGTTVRTLRQALVNAAQGSSLLQVADGALGQVTEILQRQKTLAVQAGSGNLSNTDRSFLNQEFQALTQQIDFIASTSSFNGVNLISGALSNASSVQNTATNASAGALTVSFNNTIAAGETVIINGVTMTSSASTPAGAQFLLGATVAETVNNLAARLNQLSTDNSLVGVSSFTSAQQLALSEVEYSAVGNNLVITSRSGGAVSDSFRVSTAGTATVNDEAIFSGSYTGTSFNLFTDASSTTITSTSYVLSDTGGSAAADPFDVGESLKITIGGIQKTLFTFTSGGGSGTSGAYTLQDLANGINANKDTTGVGASVVYNGTSYNIRLSYDSQNGVAILDGDSSFNSTTFKFTGDNIDLSTGFFADPVGADSTKSIVATDGYRDLFTADLTDGNITSAATDITAAGASAALPLSTGGVISATVNGTTYVLHTLAATDSLNAIVTGINTQTAITGIYAVVDQDSGDSDFNIRLYVSDPSGVAAASGIALGFSGTLDASAAAAAGTVVANGTSGVTRAAVSGLVGGADDGLGLGTTSISSTSTIGDQVLTAISQVKAESRVLLTTNASAGETLTFGGKVFYFTATATASAAPNEILIGDSIAETLDNAVTILNRYFADGHTSPAEGYFFNQVNITRDGDALVFQGKKLDNVLTAAGGTVGVSTSVTSASVTSSTLSNAASTFGIKVNGVSNSAFAGTVSGFEATYTGTADQVDLSIKIGDYTYTADNVDLTISSNTTIRFFSDTLADGSSGGYFDVQLRANEITSFSNQAGADEAAARLDAAFSSVTFLQNRILSSYTGGGAFSTAGSVTGSLLGTKVTAQLADFDDLTLTDVSVAAPSGSATDATIRLTIGGITYTSANDIGSTLSANQTYRLTSSEDVNQYIEFTTGDTAITLVTSDNASVFEDALRTAFGAVDGSSALSFQIGTSSDQSLSVSIGAATSSSLFNGASLSIATLADASTASDAIDVALSTVTSIRANVGALQSRFNFASANIQISVQNQDASRSELLDTDIAEESTKYATSQVQLQAGISVLAQANQQLQALLKLLG